MSSSSNTFGYNKYPDPIPYNPRFNKSCYKCNGTIDPLTEHGKLAKEESKNQFMCFNCHTKMIEDIQMKLNPHSEDTQKILYGRIRNMEEKLKQDEIDHIRKQNRIKIFVKTPKRFQKQKQQSNPQKQVKEQLQQPKQKLKIFVKRRSRQQQQPSKPWKGLL